MLYPVELRAQTDECGNCSNCRMPPLKAACHRISPFPRPPASKCQHTVGTPSARKRRIFHIAPSVVSALFPKLRIWECQSSGKLRFVAEAVLAPALISARIRSMSTLSEIEQAADSLSAEELRALLGHVETRLKLAESGARSKAADHLIRTLRELSRPIGGKSWASRDELHER